MRTAEQRELRAYVAQAAAGGERLQLAARMEQLATAAPNSIAAHMELLHRTNTGAPITLPPHMQVWAWLAEHMARYRWVCIVAPTGYAKTTFWSVGYPAWELGRDPRLRIGLISAVAGAAYENSKAIQQVVLQPLYRAVYGAATTPAYDWGWAQERWYLQGGTGPPTPSLLAMGMDGPILGKRFDRIVIDDPTTQEVARSRTLMAEQRKKLKTTIITRLPPGHRPPENRPDMEARMVVVCTRWSLRDLVPELEQMGFKIITMPALGYWDASKDPLTGEWHYGNAPLWEAVESQAQLLDLRRAYGALFDLVWQGNAKAGSGPTTFDPDNFQRGRCPYGSLGNVTAWVDTASGKERERGDYFAMAVLGANKLLPDPGTEVWVAHVERARIGTLDQEGKVEAVAYQMAALGCPIEAIWIATTNEGGSSLYQRLAARTRLPIMEAEERESKEWRAVPLAAGYRLRYVHHDNQPWAQVLEAELEQFPDTEHDDQVDCVAGAYSKMFGGSGFRMRTLHAPRRRR